MKLRECPFCGAAPVAVKWHGGGPRKIMIECQNDEGCVVRPSVSDNDPEVARASWNQRAGPYDKAATLDSVILDLGVIREQLSFIRARRSEFERAAITRARMEASEPSDDPSLEERMGRAYISARQDMQDAYAALVRDGLAG